MADMFDSLRASRQRAEHMREHKYVAPQTAALRAKIQNNRTQFNQAIKAWREGVDSYKETRTKAKSKLEEMHDAIKAGYDSVREQDESFSDTLGL